MCVGSYLRVEAEGLKLDFLNPHQPRKHLQERMPQMVLCVCVCVCGREREREGGRGRPAATARQNRESGREGMRETEQKR